MERAARLVRAHEIDVLMLAECSIEPSEVIKTLNSDGGVPYVLPESESEKVRIYTRLPSRALVELFDDRTQGVTLRKLKIGPHPYLLLAAVHLPSKLYLSQDDQTLNSTVIARLIRSQEDKLGHSRTILVGDFNMNPFEPGVVGAQAFNAMMTRDLARRNERKMRDISYPFFYNPMWAFFGDWTSGPAGTYYYSATTPSNQYWNIFDQVFVRPSLIDSLLEVRILDTDGQEKLLSKGGLPNRINASDHLPLFFKLNF